MSRPVPATARVGAPSQVFHWLAPNRQRLLLLVAASLGVGSTSARTTFPPGGGTPSFPIASSTASFSIGPVKASISGTSMSTAGRVLRGSTNVPDVGEGLEELLVNRTGWVRSANHENGQV